VTSADIDELIALAEATSEAAEKASATTRVRSTDIQLTAVKEHADRFAERARELTVTE
jgi:anti-sigma factor ChrR (cupin superfamily)